MRNGSAVVVTYNSAGALESCLKSILRNSDWETVVVDNASADDAGRVVAQFPRARFLRNETNRGFGAAANQGAKTASGDVIVVLNPDVIAEAESLQKLAAALAQEGVGAAGGALVDALGRTQRGFQFRRFPTLGAMLAEVLLLNRIWAGNRWNRRYR